MTATIHQDLQWSIARRPKPGQSQSGDGHLVMRTPSGWLLAVVDGLGHGPEAAAAGDTFLRVLERHAESDLVRLIRLGHVALKNSRGIACAVATIDGARGRLDWLGIGNVEGVVCRGQGSASAPEYITMRGGIVGYRLPDLRPSSLSLGGGDIVAMATDGIDGDFVERITPGVDPRHLALSILGAYGKSSDDALVLVARWQPYPGTREGGER